jgi:integrase/recombinase XerC/integrase/recombinase XerD
MKNWDRLQEKYLEEYAARGIAPATVQGVRRELDRMGCWLKHRRPRPALEELGDASGSGSELLIAYVRSRTAYKAKATVSGVMSIMRGFGEFLVRDATWHSNPLRWMRGPKPQMRVPRRFGRGALQKLWEAAASARRAYHRHLWLAALGLLYGTGLRRGELSRLNVCDWSAEDGTLKVDGRKTARQRQLAVPELARRCVESYLPVRQNHLEQLGASGEQALLIDKDGGRLSGAAISHAVKRLASGAGLSEDGLTLRHLRHTCASDLLERGVGLPQVQRLLGHQTITTTMRYLHVADPQRHQAVALHPINQILAGIAAAADDTTIEGGVA